MKSKARKSKPEPKSEKERFGTFTQEKIDEELLESEPESATQHFRCKVNITTWNKGKAVVLDGEHARKRIELPTKESLGKSFDGDIVVVKLQGNFKEHEPSFGKVQVVLERCRDVGYQTFVCKLDKQKPDLMCPVDKQSTKIKVKTHGLDVGAVKYVSIFKFKNGFSGRMELKKQVELDYDKMYCVRCLKWDAQFSYPLGYVEKVYSFNIRTYAEIYNVPGPFSRDVKEEAIAFEATEPDRYKDCTHLYAFTIDSTNTKVFDDALSIEKCTSHDDCWKIWTHITNVSSVVPRGSKVDNEAEKRVASFNDTTKGMKEGHMLPPEVLDKCSLTKGKKRLAVSVLFHSSLPPAHRDTSNEDEVDFTEVLLTEIKVEKNLTFAEVDEYLQECSKKRFSDVATETLSEKLHQLWNVFWSMRVKRLGTAAVYHQMSLSDYRSASDELLGNILVEEAMITANLIFSQFLCEKSVQFIARSQDKPSELLQCSGAAGVWHANGSSIYQTSCYKMEDIPESRKKLVPSDGVTLFEKVKNVVTEAIDAGHHETALLLMCCDDLHCSLETGVMNYRSIQERSDDYVHNSNNDCQPHFSLRLPCYLRGTSPLQRYVDLVNQRQIVAAIEQRNCTLPSELCGKNVTNAFVRNFAKREQQVEEYKCAMDKHKFCASLCVTKAKLYLASVIEANYGVLEFSWLNRKQFPSFKFIPQFLQATHRITCGGKVLFQWDLRFYDIKEYAKSGCQTDGEETLWIVSREDWDIFREKLQNNILLGNADELASNLKKTLNAGRRNAVDEKRGQPLNRTCNGLYHQRRFALNLTPGSLVKFMAVPAEKNTFPPKLIPELINLEMNFAVCLVHRQSMDVFPVKKLCHPFLTISRWMDLVLKEGSFCSVCEGNSVTLHNLLVTFEQHTGFFKLAAKFFDERFVRMNSNDLLCLRSTSGENSEKYGWVIHAVVVQVEYKEICTIHFAYDASSVYTPLLRKLREIEVTCELFRIPVIHRRMLHALAVIDEDTPKVVKNLLFGNVAYENEHYQLSKSQKKLDDELLQGFQLNNSQKEQICKALEQKITLIQGPPGTGKSVLGMHLAYYLWKLNKQLSNKRKILYCGPSNKSVDVVAGYLTKAKTADMKFVRVYANSLEECDYPVPVKPKSTGIAPDDVNKPDEDLAAIALHKIIRNRGPYAEEIKEFDRNFAILNSSVVSHDSAKAFSTLKKYKEYKDLISKAKLHELRQCDVILCTCSTAGNDLIPQLKFAQCIIDECGMCSEPETLIPITASMHEIVLIGDHKQLSPIVKCKEAKALSRSVFERLSEHASMLTTQYRMHPDICEFPSWKFYDEKLETAEVTRKRQDNLVFGQTVTRFFHVKGKEMEEPDSYSKYNMEEVDVVNYLVMQLVEEHNVAPKKIMVLSPYLGQCNKLREKLQQSFDERKIFDKLHIGSVVTSQGSEAEFVFVSTVRSFHVYGNCSYDTFWMYKRLGFLIDEHQVNVAITRAKLGMFIVGNKELLRVNKHCWGELVDHYENEIMIAKVEILPDKEGRKQLQFSEDDGDFGGDGA